MSEPVIGYNNGCPAAWESRGPDLWSLKAIDGYLGGVELHRSKWVAIYSGRARGYHRRAFPTIEEAKAHVEAMAWKHGRLFPNPSPWHDYDDRQSVILIPGDAWKVADVVLLGKSSGWPGWCASVRRRSARSTRWAAVSYGHATRDAAKAAAEAWLRQKRVIW